MPPIENPVVISVVALIGALCLFFIYRDAVKPYLTKPFMYVVLENGTYVVPMFVRRPSHYQCVIPVDRTIRGFYFPSAAEKSHLEVKVTSFKPEGGLTYIKLLPDYMLQGIELRPSRPLARTHQDAPLCIWVTDSTRPAQEYGCRIIWAPAANIPPSADAL